MKTYTRAGIEMPYHCRAWLKKKYTEEDMSTYEIARLCEVSPSTIREFLVKFGIERRNKNAPRIYGAIHLGAKWSEPMYHAIKTFAKKKEVSISRLMFFAITEYMLRNGFNPFKDN